MSPNNDLARLRIASGVRSVRVGNEPDDARGVRGPAIIPQLADEAANDVVLGSLALARPGQRRVQPWRDL